MAFLNKVYLIALLILVWFNPSSVLGHDIDGKVTVHMNSQGFSPRQVQINQGESIIFENADQNPHWPASNIHPTHVVRGFKLG